jgi:uracil phosphoribosyltransferase
LSFSGSYLKDDVEFLLKVIDIDFTSIEEKEKRIQSGKSHYSEMINQEYEPTEAYLKTFHEVYALNKMRFAKDILSLAYHLNQKENIVLVSLVRAGTPIGVLLKRVLKEIFKREVKHYSISIIRDREIDNIALAHITKEYPQSEMIFLDGWTGKGVINRELKQFIAEFNKTNNQSISDKLYVISDIAGVADFSVTHEDYLIPSSALNSTISGLVSRSILNDTYIQKDDFHGCKYYDNYQKSDMSLWFVKDVLHIVHGLTANSDALAKKDKNLHQSIESYLSKIMQKYEVTDINHIKPGIGESTRVLLRRVPYIILVKDLACKDIEHLVHLAKEKTVKIVEDKTLPYTALAIIKNLQKD